jgi:ubiquinone/menaquinone biosynthesis C-methylase UbiE
MKINIAAALCCFFNASNAFVTPNTLAFATSTTAATSTTSSATTTTTTTRSNHDLIQLKMGLDLVTSLRTEWISASICTNQIPREATSVLQLGTEDARAVTFVPRSVDEIITSSAEKDGLSISTQRQLKQQRERRGTGAVIKYADQRADDLKETDDESVDVVISLQAADKMRENGLDWKNSIREAARVLKPGGKFIFVEKAEIEGDKYLDVIASVATSSLVGQEDNADESKEEEELYPTFELIGYDDVDLVIVPHIAGVVMKTANAGMSETEINAKLAADEKARIADLSISAFERGLKKRRKKKKKNVAAEDQGF